MIKYYSTRLIDGSYPDTARLIPLEFDYELDINRADLLNAIDRVSLLLNEQNNIVKLDMSNEQVILSSYQQEIGSVEENLASSFYKGEPLTIHLVVNMQVMLLNHLVVIK